VLIEGKLCCEIQIFRFVVTEDAWDWLRVKCPALVLPPNADFYEKNMKYALVGQSILSRGFSLQASGGRGMILMTKEQFLASPPPLLLNQMFSHLFLHAKAEPDWDSLRDLEESIRDDADWMDPDLNLLM